MEENASVERLEALAAWYRGKAGNAGSAWVWDARLRTAEELERQAVALRRRLEGKVSEGKVSVAGFDHAA